MPLKDLELIERDLLMRMAAILGAHSAASQALSTLDARTALGESVVCYKSGRTLLVGPRVEVQGARP